MKNLYRRGFLDRSLDTRFYGNGHTGEECYQMFDTLYGESQRLPRVTGIPLHPFQTGQPLRIREFEKAVRYMQKDKVWFATGSESLDAYRKIKTQG